jgi:hypothetical protein
MSSIVPAVGGSAAWPLGLAAVKGDLFVATGLGTITRLPAGAATQVLVVDPLTATGLRWATSTTTTTPAGLGIGPLGISPLGS